MVSFPGGKFHWRIAIIVSAAVHVLLCAAGWFWRSAEDSKNVSTHRVNLQIKRPSVRLGDRPDARLTPTGEESSETQDSVGFQSSFSAQLLINPMLEPAGVGNGAPRDKSHLTAATSNYPTTGTTGNLGSPGKGGRFFGVAAGEQAKRIVFVVDASSSMGRGGLWQRAARAVTETIDSLPADTSYQVIVYHSRARALMPARPGWLGHDADTRRQVSQALHELLPEGKTDHAPALNLALAMRPDVVFFLTDADDLSFELLRQVDAWNHAKAVIHTFELNAPHNRPGSPLQMLAQRHNGEHRAIPP